MKFFRRRTVLLLGLVVVFVLEIWQFVVSQPSKHIEIPSEATTTATIQSREVVAVKFVLDGDTIELTDGRRVRYIGIDAPEIAHEGRKEGCFAKESQLENKRLVDGKTVELEKDISETDAYGRLLRYVYVEDVLVNDSLIENGFAKAWNVPPDERHKATLFDSHGEAKAKNLGLWKQCGR